MKKTMLLFIICFSGLLSKAQQDAISLLKQTTQAYVGADNLSMDVVVHTYASANSTSILLGNGLIRKSGVNYYSKFLTDELVVNENCTLVLDHQDKTITRYGPDEKKKKNKFKGQISFPDSLYSCSDSIVYKGLEDGKQHFLFFSKNKAAAVNLTEVFINDQTHFVTQIVYYYNDMSNDEAYDMYKVVIDYTNISTTRPSDSFFSERNYITYSKGKPALTSSYSSYKLIIAQ